MPATPHHTTRQRHGTPRQQLKQPADTQIQPNYSCPLTAYFSTNASRNLSRSSSSCGTPSAFDWHVQTKHMEHARSSGTADRMWVVQHNRAAAAPPRQLHTSLKERKTGRRGPHCSTAVGRATCCDDPIHTAPHHPTPHTLTLPPDQHFTPHLRAAI